MGGLTVEWDGEEKPFPFIQSQLDNLDSQIAQAKAPERPALVAKRKAMAANLALAKDVQASIKNMVSFASAPQGPGRDARNEVLLKAGRPAVVGSNIDGSGSIPRNSAIRCITASGSAVRSS